MESAGGSWRLGALGHHSPQDADAVHGYTKWVDPDTVYRLRLFDAFADGTCCQYGRGWFTITDATPSHDYAEGTVVWEANGNILESSLDVFLWVDSDYHAQVVEHLSGEAYALIQEDSEA